MWAAVLYVRFVAPGFSPAQSGMPTNMPTRSLRTGQALKVGTTEECSLTLDKGLIMLAAKIHGMKTPFERNN
jgi:hypothetical protein